MKRNNSNYQGTLWVILTVLVHCSFAWGQVGISSGTELDVSRNFASKPVPQWENGFLFGYEMDPPTAPPVYAYDQNGHKLFETPLALDSAIRIVPGAMAASRDGLFAISGSAYSASGDGVVFIAVLDRTGRLVRVTRTGRFAPIRLCYTSDGTLWASGRPVTYPSIEEPPDHDILRAYNADGTLRMSLLPQSTFPKAPHKSHPVRISNLSSNGKLIAFLSVEYNELVGISSEGNVLFRNQFAPPGPDYYVTGFAVSADSEIYMSCQVASPVDKKRLEVAFYRWDGAASKWQKVYSGPLTGNGAHHAIFGFGADGMLVSTKLPHFKWVQVP